LRGIEGGGRRPAAPRRGRWSQQEQNRLKELYGLRDDATIARELNRPIASVRKMAEKLFPERHRTGPWTASEAVELKRYLGATSTEVIARILGRSEEEVDQQIMALGRIQTDRGWSRAELGDFKRIYGRRTDEDLSRIFGRSERAIRELAEKLALSKDKAFLRKLNGESSTRMPRWRADELELLRAEYATASNLSIAKKLGRSVKSVVSKAHNMGLKKSPDRLRRMGRENVSLRYQE
jgi:hypothetical protein